MASTSAMTRTYFRSATARTPATNTRESKSETIRSPPLISSTKGAQTKKRPRAMRSCTAEKRRNLSRGSTGLSSLSFPWFWINEAGRHQTACCLPLSLVTVTKPRCLSDRNPTKLLTESVTLHRVDWTEPVEFLDFDVPGSRGLSCPNGASLRHLLLLLSVRARLLA